MVLSRYLFSLLFLIAIDASSEPETICGIAHVQKGAEDQFRLLEQQSWDVYLRLELVKPELHVVLEGVEDGDKPFFVVVFTWKKRLGGAAIEIWETPVISARS